MISTSNLLLRRDNGRIHLLNLISTKPELIARHLANYRVVEGSGCHEWIGALSSGKSKEGHADNERYGVVSIGVDGKSTKVQAHRLSYANHYGVDPDEFFVLHSCDFSRCINPHHLSLGTHADNMTDMVSKGRASKQGGSSNGNAKTSEETAIRVFQMLMDGKPNKAIVAETGCSQDMVSLMKRGKRWKSLAVDLGYLQDQAA